jgi:hypothetical protein
MIIAVKWVLSGFLVFLSRVRPAMEMAVQARTNPAVDGDSGI